MVDIVLLQSASYVAAAIGVCVAAVYYVLNLRETTRNRRIALTNSLMLPQFFTEQGMKQLIDLMSLEWEDYADFLRKYDSQVNPEASAKRLAVWNIFDAIGHQYRIGMLDADTVFSCSSIHATNMWLKFKPIIDEYRKTDYGRDAFLDFEYLAGEMARIKAERDSSWKGSASYFKPETYEKVFKK